MLQDQDAAKANRVMQAMLRMDKLNIATLRQAYELKQPVTSAARASENTEGDDESRPMPKSCRMQIGISC